MKEWMQKFIKWFYKDKETVITYDFQKTESIDILARFLVHERKIINIDLYDVTEYGTRNNGATFFFKIKTKEDKMPPPPPKNTIDNSNDNQPHGVSL
jgi:hypothetical protein